MRLYERLAEGSLAAKNLAGKHLVKGSGEFSDEDILCDPEEMGKLIGNFNRWGSLETSWWIEGLTLNFHHALRRDRVELMYHHVGGILQEQARRRGVEGGLLFYQVGPKLTLQKTHVYRHKLTLLGLANLPKHFHDPDAWGVEVVENSHPRLTHLLAPSWAVLPTDAPQALRFLLVGSSFDYRGPVKPVVTQCSWDEHGIVGALAHQPLFMFDPVQWFSYAAAVKGLRLYRTFGNWVGELGPARKPPKDLLATEADLAAERQRRALKRGNAARRADAQGRREELLALARPLWAEVRAAQERRRGRPALRQPLRALLAREGIEVGNNELDWLVTTLNKKAKTAAQTAEAPAASA